MSLHESRVLLETFHFLLKAQTVRLVERFGCPPALFSVVGRLWLSYVEWWRREAWGADDQHMIVFKSAPGIRKNAQRAAIDEHRRKREAALAAVDGEAEEKEGKAAEGRGEEKAEQPTEEELKRKRRALRLAPLQVAELSMPLSLALLFIALRSLRQPLTMAALQSLARVGQLPYLAFVREEQLPPRLYGLLQQCPAVLSFFRPSSVPTPRALVRLVRHVVRVLALPASTLSLDPYPLLAWYAEQMRVPPLLYGLLHELVRIVRDLRGIRRSMDERRVMGCLVLGLKMVYGLDRVSEREGDAAAEEQKRKRRRKKPKLTLPSLPAHDDVDDAAPPPPHTASDEDGEDDEEDDEKGGQGGQGEQGHLWVQAELERIRADRAAVTVHHAPKHEADLETEMADYQLLLARQREDDERMAREERDTAGFYRHCFALIQRIAQTPVPPPLPPSDDLVLLFNPPTLFPSSPTSARLLPTSLQESLLQFWERSVLPPSLALDDFAPYLEQITAALPPPPPPPPPSLSTFFAHVSGTLSSLSFQSLTVPHRAPGTVLHTDYELVLHAAGLLLGVEALTVEKEVRHLVNVLGRVGSGGKRWRSVTWRVASKEEKRQQRLRLKRKRGQDAERRTCLHAEEEAEELGDDPRQQDSDRDERLDRRGVDSSSDDDLSLASSSSDTSRSSIASHSSAEGSGRDWG